jgi:hypothetical protein
MQAPDFSGLANGIALANPAVDNAEGGSPMTLVKIEARVP